MKVVSILLIEDNEGDIMLTKEAFEESKIVNKIIVARDGQQAVNYFEGQPASHEIPHLILLDINLPKMNGHEVLQYIKSNETYKSIPVIMLTTSSSNKDITQCYKKNVNCYVTKPIDVSDFMQVITKIEDFWINIVTTPAR